MAETETENEESNQVDTEPSSEAVEEFLDLSPDDLAHAEVAEHVLPLELIELFFVFVRRRCRSRQGEPLFLLLLGLSPLLLALPLFLFLEQSMISFLNKVLRQVWSELNGSLVLVEARVKCGHVALLDVV